MNTKAAKEQAREATTQENRQSTKGKSSSKGESNNGSSQEPSYTASISGSTIPPDLANAVLRLQTQFSKDFRKKTKIWLLIQSGRGENVAATEGGYNTLNEETRMAFFSERNNLPQKEQLVLLIDSLGGQAKAAYQLAMFFRHYCDGFIALVPKTAKSAATLLTLGADDIMLGSSGELGPVDAQVREGEHFVPALDRVKTLERQHASALEALDRAMALLTLRSEQDVKELMPAAIEFAARVSKPYLERTDMVDYTRKSRLLKIGEDYASRLLERQFERKEAPKQDGGKSDSQGDHQPPLRKVTYDAALNEIRDGDYGNPIKRMARLLAQHLVGSYPDHDFAIDVEEAKRIGLPVRDPSTDDMASMIDELHQLLPDRDKEPLSAIGQVVKVNDE
jgi:ClpP class serine protease